MFICFLKFNFESILILSCVTDETDFMFISPICNFYEPVFPRVINWDLSGFAFTELYRKYSIRIRFTCLVYTTSVKAVVISKIIDFTFCWEKEQIIDKNIKK